MARALRPRRPALLSGSERCVGYTAIQAYLPSSRISVALAVTKGPRAAANTAANYSEELFQTISEYLTPDHPAKF